MGIWLCGFMGCISKKLSGVEWQATPTLLPLLEHLRCQQKHSTLKFVVPSEKFFCKSITGLTVSAGLRCVEFHFRSMWFRWIEQKFSILVFVNFVCLLLVCSEWWQTGLWSLCTFPFLQIGVSADQTKVAHCIRAGWGEHPCWTSSCFVL